MTLLVDDNAMIENSFLSGKNSFEEEDPRTIKNSFDGPPHL